MHIENDFVCFKLLISTVTVNTPFI